jgi:hypothetical protein
MRLSQLGLVVCGIGVALFASANLAVIGISGILRGFGYGPVTPASSHILI